MRIQLRSSVVLKPSTRWGRHLVLQLIILVRATLISIFTFVVAVNYWRLDSIKSPMKTSAAILQYPVYIFSKPFLSENNHSRYINEIPAELGICPRIGRFDKYLPYYHDDYPPISKLSEVNHLYSPHWNSNFFTHLTISTPIYYFLFNLFYLCVSFTSAWLAKRRWPNP